MTRAAEPGGGGNFYLTVNGRNFLVRGATYTPDLLYRYDPDRDWAILRYAKDLGLNMLRPESKIVSTRLVEMADEMGIPLMYGWMCCNQWERWPQWDDGDNRWPTACALKSPALARTPRCSSGPTAVTAGLRMRCGRLTTASSTTCTGRTPSSTPSPLTSPRADGTPLWDGIEMSGPYSWRPPSYWFAGTYPAPAVPAPNRATTSTSRRMPACAGSSRRISCGRSTTPGTSTPAPTRNASLTSIRRIIDWRWDVHQRAVFADKGSAGAIREHPRPVQGVRRRRLGQPQDDHLLDAQQPLAVVLRQHLRLLPAARRGVLRRQGLRPLSVVFDSTPPATSQAKVTVVSQAQGPAAGCGCGCAPTTW